MADTNAAPEDAAAARAAQQARLRKERREAKIKAGGANRLNKITGLGGGVQRDPEPSQSTPSESATPQATATPPPAAAAKDHAADPEEVDISQHFYSPATTNRPPPPAMDPANMSEAQLRQMMLGLDRPMSGGAPGMTNPFLAAGGAGAPPPGMPGMEGLEGLEGMGDDPMMKMLTQMMSGGGGGIPGFGGGGGPGGSGGNPYAGMEGLFPGGGGGNPMAQAQQAVSDRSANLWRILHAVFALGLGLFVALSTTFAGTREERDAGDAGIASSGFLAEYLQTGDGEGHVNIERTKAYFFYLFTSVEAVLLTSRLFLDRNRAPPTGMAWTVSGFLPDPFRSYLQHALRYGQIFSTVRNDALFCVFVLGVCCWLRS